MQKEIQNILNRSKYILNELKMHILTKKKQTKNLKIKLKKLKLNSKEF